MKKTILTIIAIIIFATVNTTSAQLDQFANSGPIAQDLIEGGYIQETANGDLNKDGLNDLVIGVPEGIAIYFGNNDGYKLYNTYECPSLEVDEYKFNRQVSITSKGVLKVSEDITRTTDEQSASINIVHMLRYQDNDFYLIGGKLSALVEGNFVAFSFNMLSNKMIMQDKYGNALTEPTDIPEFPLKSISEFSLASPTALEKYGDQINMGNLQFSKELFALQILEQISKMEDEKDYPTFNSQSGAKLWKESFEDLAIWGKKEHQHFQFNWQHDPYDEDLDGYLDCFPLKDGGYFVMFTVVETGDYEHYFPHYYTFKDNVLTETDKYLPHPTINDYYSNAAKFPKKIYNALNRELQYPEYFYSQEDKTLTVTFDPWSCDETGCDLPEDLKCFQGNGDGDSPSFPTAVYVWKDGKFVFAPDYKPLEENLNYFK